MTIMIVHLDLLQFEVKNQIIVLIYPVVNPFFCVFYYKEI